MKIDWSNKMKYKINALSLIVFFILMLVGPVFYAAKNWVFKIEYSKNNTKVVSLNEYLRSYYAYLDLQSTLGGATPGTVKKLRLDKKKRKEYSQHYLNQTLIERFAKKRNIVNMKQINAKIRRMSEVIKQLMIVKQFVAKIVEPKVKKVTKHDVRVFYNRYKNNRAFRARVKGQSFANIKKYIRQLIYRRRKAALMQKYLTRLRERSKISANEAIFK